MCWVVLEGGSKIKCEFMVVCNSLFGKGFVKIKKINALKGGIFIGCEWSFSVSSQRLRPSPFLGFDLGRSEGSARICCFAVHLIRP